MAAPPPAAPAGVVPSAAGTAGAPAAERAGPLLAEVAGRAAGVSDPVGTLEPLELLDWVGSPGSVGLPPPGSVGLPPPDSVGLPPPGESPPGVEPRGGRGEETVGEAVTDVGTGDLLLCEPWPWWWRP
jgi:hypothetical protein